MSLIALALSNLVAPRALPRAGSVAGRATLEQGELGWLGDHLFHGRFWSGDTLRLMAMVVLLHTIFAVMLRG